MQAKQSELFNFDRSLCDLKAGISELRDIVTSTEKMSVSCFDATHYSHKYMFSSLTDYDFKDLAC